MRTERHGEVLVVILNRPDRLNALTTRMELRYLDILREADDDPQTGAVVVTGAGRGFCAGFDMAELALIGTSEQAPPIAPDLRTSPLRLRKPLIAAINGPAAGMGLVHALYCDYRLAAESARLTTAFTRRGLVPEYGVSWLLPRIVGLSAALDLLLSGRSVLATEAREMRLVDRVCPPGRVLEDAISYAADIVANCSLSAVATTKRMVYAQLECDFQTALSESFQTMLAALAKEDAIEGVASFRERRAPRFAPLGALGEHH